MPEHPMVVAVVPAKDRADSIAATVDALASVSEVARVLVVDDGSTDDTSARATAAGADVLRLPVNVGKGDAVRAAVAATPDVDVYLLIDADLGDTAALASALLRPVLADEADMAIGVLPRAGRRGGFGLVRRLAASGIRRAAGHEPRAPLSGQRAVRAEYLRSLDGASRFGLEVAMTIDAARAGARIVEIDVAMDHRHTGRSVGGFAHRARQGGDIARALWPRLSSIRIRLGLITIATAVALAAMLWSGDRWQPASVALGARPSKVVVFGTGPMGFDDLGHGRTPTIDAMIREGALAAMSVRTVARHPSQGAGYLSLGAGSRLTANTDAGQAYDADTELPGGTAAELLAVRTARPAQGDIAVLGGVGAVKVNGGSQTSTDPGALGDALVAAGHSTAAVGNSDQPAAVGPGVVSRPAALAAMSSDLTVAHGTVSPDLLIADPGAPFGVRADADALLAAVDDALAEADVVFVDPGDLERADRFGGFALGGAAAAQRAAALERTDTLLAALRERLPDDTLLIVLSVAPPGGAYRLTPFVAVGPGVPAGYAVSPSTKRLGVVAITDVAPTVLDAVGVAVPGAFPGNPLRYHAGAVDLGYLRDFDIDTDLKERTYYPQAVGFITFQALVYLGAMFVVARRTRIPHAAPVLRIAVLAAAAYPLATYLLRLAPATRELGVGGAGLAAAIAVAIALVVSRARRHPLSPLTWIMGTTVAVLVVDASTGTWLHVSSWLGYSLHSAGRFYGIPNTTFAVLAGAALLLGCAHVQFAPRRSEAVVAAGALFAIVVIADGAPTLGGDVGGILALVPVFVIALVAMAGQRVRLRTLLITAGATVAVLGMATAADLLRPESQRTHLGRFASDFFDDPTTLWDTFTRKQSANLRILQSSIWTWMLPVVVVFLLYVLVWERQWSDLLPTASPLRVGIVGVLFGALLGFLANDSGPIVIALFFVFPLPYLTLLALQRGRGSPPALLSASTKSAAA